MIRKQSFIKTAEDRNPKFASSMIADNMQKDIESGLIIKKT